MYEPKNNLIKLKCKVHYTVWAKFVRNIIYYYWCQSIEKAVETICIHLLKCWNCFPLYFYIKNRSTDNQRFHTNKELPQKSAPLGFTEPCWILGHFFLAVWATTLMFRFTFITLLVSFLVAGSSAPTHHQTVNKYWQQLPSKHREHLVDKEQDISLRSCETPKTKLNNNEWAYLYHFARHRTYSIRHLARNLGFKS